MTPIRVSDVSIPPGQRQRIEIRVARLPTESWLSIPVEVVHGMRPGPHLWLSAAVHGDELNGIEIIRAVLDRLKPEELRGAVLAAPIVNVFGFVHQSRYLPDRRDLNRSFPGSPRGSMASRLAWLFTTEVVSQCTHGIDLHTGSHHRTNLPQIRANLNDAETRRCAEAFGAPVILHSQLRDGSLRQAATKGGSHALVYEAGEPLRFDPEAIRMGVDGVLRVLAALKMRPRSPKKSRTPPVELSKATWIRARRGGILRLGVQLGQVVKKGERLGTIGDAFGDESVDVKATHGGIVIGQTNNPLVNQGDGIVHIGRIRGDSVEAQFTGTTPRDE